MRTFEKTALCLAGFRTAGKCFAVGLLALRRFGCAELGEKRILLVKIAPEELEGVVIEFGETRASGREGYYSRGHGGYDDRV